MKIGFCGRFVVRTFYEKSPSQDASAHASDLHVLISLSALGVRGWLLPPSGQDGADEEAVRHGVRVKPKPQHGGTLYAEKQLFSR